MRRVRVGVEDAGFVEDVADGVVLVALTGLSGDAADQAPKGPAR